MRGDRTIGVAMDYSKSSKSALDWTIENLLDKDETLILLHVLPEEGNETGNQLWSPSGSREFFVFSDHCRLFAVRSWRVLTECLFYVRPQL